MACFAGEVAWGAIIDAAATEIGDQRRYWQSVNAAIALSIVLDSVLLAGFVLTGTVSAIVPIGYAAVALGLCACFYFYISRIPRDRLRGGHIALPMVISSGATQLLFIWLAPQVAFYFLLVLFIVFSVGSTSLSIRQAILTWSVATIATAALLYGSRGTSWTPQTGVANHLMVWLCFVASLGRCTLIGMFGQRLRARLQERRRVLSKSVATRDKSLELVNAELLYQATHDALTDLPNRTLFADRLASAVHEGRPFAIAVLDLDRFKVINDSLGHGAGDALLKLVAQRLVATMRSMDTIARAGGDEFLMLLRDVDSRQDIEQLAARWLDTLSSPYRVHDTELHVSPSIGIARHPLDGAHGPELLARADEAMYHAKQSGRNMFRFFDADVTSFSRERLVMEAELRHAMANSELYLHYQPRVEVGSGAVRSVEALLRWQHPRRGCVMPGEFISIAEDSGLILPIGDWVIREACRQARSWQLQGLPFLRVAVNVSPVQFRQLNFCKVVSDALEANSLDAAYLEIELTEATLMTTAETSVVMLEQLSQLGVVISIDDFGTGYSSMSYLQRFPIDKLKIDRSFISNLMSNSSDVSIVRAIISLAHELKLKVVAEGVESAEQLALLDQMGCDQYQGFLRSPAVAPAEVQALLAPTGAAQASEPGAERTHSKLAGLLLAKA
jgi:diguanylate cyclase (GGDEF)-like protein